MSLSVKLRCSVCGTQSPATTEFCPVCLLHIALGEGAELAESASQHGVAPAPRHPAPRFEHYELLTDEDGMPIELGRGAMGITYKAFDVDLHLPVALKVISERFLADESARSRFLREARAAASLRHPNVASVFHLGRTGENYFYAMEFVEGQTLDSLIKGSGALEVGTALEIAGQVAAGLAALHRQKLVHRDIKPGNIMVSFGDAGAVTAKIIDFGLAKAANEPSAQSTISTAGGFAGTPEFASPEQFAGVGVDIRSDLYSLGVTLWETLTGRGLFRGSAAEVMYQHQHGRLPLEQLEAVPQPVVALTEALLEKDPRRRIQTPTELLRVIPAIVEAIGAGRTITDEILGRIPDVHSCARARKPPTRVGRISIAGLRVARSDIFGREEDIAFLDNAWANPGVNVVTILALAGVGKSALVGDWLRRLAAKAYPLAELVFGWTFQRPDGSEGCAMADEFLDIALPWFDDRAPAAGSSREKGERLAGLIAQRRALLILDGLEPCQDSDGPREGRLREPSLQALLPELAAFNRGLCVITTRLPVLDIANSSFSAAITLPLEELSAYRIERKAAPIDRRPGSGGISGALLNG